MSPAARAGVLIALGLFMTFFGGMLVLGTRTSPDDPDQPPPGSRAARRRRRASIRLYGLAITGAIVTIAGIVSLIIVAT